MILIDPRRTETARYATKHHFITPGTDAVFLLAILRTLFEKGLVNPSHLQSWLKGWEDIEPLSRAFTLDQAALITVIPATEIERIAVDFGSANAAICYGRMGVSTQEFGALCQWLIQVINIATGNLDRAGGMMFSRPAIDLLRSEARGSFDTYRSRVRGLAEFGRELPSSVLAEEMLTEGEGQIKAFITTAGNPVLSTPNGKKLEQALPELEFMVSIDFYINETTCHADIILPPTGPLEHGHYDLVFNLFAVRDVAKFSPPMFKPAPGALNDRKIYQGLISRINRLRGKKTSLKERMWAGLQKLFPYLASNQFILDLGLRLGPYGKGFLPFAKGLTLKRLKSKPHGIDLGPLKSALPDRLFTKDKKIDVAPKILTEDLVRLKARYANMEQSAQDKGHLLLIGRRDVRTNNSWMHNSLRLVKGKNRCTLLIHPDDAARHTIADGQLVTVTSRTGAVTANAEITDAIYRGVVSLPHGWGHDRSGISMDVASAHAGVSVNDITDDLLIDQVCGNASVNGVPVALNI